MIPKRPLLLVFALGAAVVACTLQPQPLPPDPTSLAGTGDDSNDGDHKGGNDFGATPPSSASDAAVENPDGADGSSDAGDGDGGAGDGGG